MAGRKLNVLLVEDNELDVLSLRRAFRRAGLPHTLVAVPTTRQAMATLRNEPDAEPLPRERRLVLLDLNIPDENGHTFLGKLRADPDLAATTVVVITGSNVDRDKLDAFRFNVAGYLVKPVDQGEFANLVDALEHYWTTSELPPT